MMSSKTVCGRVIVGWSTVPDLRLNHFHLLWSTLRKASITLYEFGADMCATRDTVQYRRQNVYVACDVTKLFLFTQISSGPQILSINIIYQYGQ